VGAQERRDEIDLRNCGARIGDLLRQCRRRRRTAADASMILAAIVPVVHASARTTIFASALNSRFGVNGIQNSSSEAALRR
jgi:hypothetical protein